METTKLVEESFVFERVLLRLLLESAETPKINHSELARQAFPDVSNPGRKWRNIRNIGSQGVPQPITLREAYRVAKVLGLDFSYYCHLATQEMGRRSQGYATAVEEMHAAWPTVSEDPAAYGYGSPRKNGPKK